MKKLLLLTFIIPVITFAQTLSNYKASNGRYYHVGDQVQLGSGTLPNGDFKTIIQSGPNNAPRGAVTGSEQSNLSRRYSGQVLYIKAILPVNRDSNEVYFVVGGWNMLSYNLYIEDAIHSCEIAECGGGK